MDALLLGRPLRSFPELSLLPAFRRQWHSCYAAIERGSQDWAWLEGFFMGQVPVKGPLLFSLDGTAWPHPAARTLAERQYVFSPTAAVDGGSIVIGHPYSVLAWVPEPGSSWGLPVSTRRALSWQSDVEVGIEQVKLLCRHRRKEMRAELHVITVDAKYGNHRSPRCQHYLQCYLGRNPPGARETVSALLAGLSTAPTPEGARPQALEDLWRWYDYRWPAEPSIRFRKQYLHWTLPRFQTAEACDRWTMLVSLAQWQLFLGRDLVEDTPLPWQPAQEKPTPERVLQGFGGLFREIGTPAAAPQRRGKSPGWPKERPRTRPQRHRVVKKGQKKPKPA